MSTTTRKTQDDTPSTERADAAKAEETKAEEAKGEFIAFTGHNGTRVITKEDWEAIEVKGQDTVTWDRTNAWRIPRGEFNARALNYLLKVDGEFRAED